MSDFWADQRQAAERETSRVFGEVKEVFQAKEIRHQTWGRKTDRWRETITRNLETRQLKMCEHLLLAPAQPAMVAAHRLDRALCEQCANLILSLEYDPVEDNTCDVCHVHFPNGIYPVAHQVGTLIVTGGICESCRAEDAT